MTAATIIPSGRPRVVQTSDGAAAVLVPIQLRRRSGQRKLRSGAVPVTGTPPELTAMQQALARGFRWREMLDSAEVPSMTEIAEKNGTDPSYVARMINVTFLAPEIIEAILDDTLPDVRLADIAVGFPLLWPEQFERLQQRKTAFWQPSAR